MGKQFWLWIVITSEKKQKKTQMCQHRENYKPALKSSKNAISKTLALVCTTKWNWKRLYTAEKKCLISTVKNNEFTSLSELEDMALSVFIASGWMLSCKYSQHLFTLANAHLIDSFQIKKRMYPSCCETSPSLNVTVQLNVFHQYKKKKVMHQLISPFSQWKQEIRIEVALISWTEVHLKK